MGFTTVAKIVICMHPEPRIEYMKNVMVLRGSVHGPKPHPSESAGPGVCAASGEALFLNRLEQPYLPRDVSRFTSTHYFTGTRGNLPY